MEDKDTLILTENIMEFAALKLLLNAAREFCFQMHTAMASDEDFLQNPISVCRSPNRERPKQ